MKYITLEKYPNYRIFEDGTVVKMSTYKTLKHTNKKMYGYDYQYVTLVDTNKKRRQLNITNIIQSQFKGVE